MRLTVRDRVTAVATFRFIHVQLLETLAYWIPTTPEMEVKILFGQHIWDIAQQADALGKRTYELRKPAHLSLRPTDDYLRVLEVLAALPTTAERLYGFYELILPDLARHYQTYLQQTDRLMDAPTVRILERMLTEVGNLRQASQALCAALRFSLMASSPQNQYLMHLQSVVQELVAPGAPALPQHDSIMTPRYTPEPMHIGGLTLRCDPVRERCFRVVHLPTEMHEYPDMSPVSQRERLHRHMNNEIGSIEIAAQCLADFPTAPWELRMQLARQCWDETRHVEMLYRRLQELGGYKGEFPVANLEWTITCMLDSLPARLAVQNRTFEAGLMDLLGKLVDRWREVGDDRTADMLDGILVDEIQHVRFANQWIKRLAQEDPRVLLHIAMAMRFLTRAITALSAQPGEVNAVGTVLGGAEAQPPAVNVTDRQHADFTSDEIHTILRQAGFRSLTLDAEGVPA
ncbi:MAG: DUF455 family protein [Candidatus Tectimicrobiota bacterium]